MIPAKTFFFYGLMLLFGILGPMILAILWKVKTKQPVTTILIGAATFFVFAIVLETIPKLVLFQGNNPVGRFIIARPFLYYGIAALLAGLFEETGRLIAFRFLLKKRQGRQTAISYGIGHGAFEAMYLMVMTGIQCIAYGIMINTGTFDAVVDQVAASAPEQLAAVQAIPSMLSEVSFVNIGLSIWERTSAIIIHIALSMLVFAAVHKKERWWLYPVAILLHAVVDVFAGMYAVGLITNVYLLEGILLVWSLVVFAVAKKCVYDRLPIQMIDETL